MAAESSATGQIQEFLRVLRRRRWTVLVPALWILVIGSCFAVIVPKKYVVETRVEVLESRNPLDYDLKFRQESATAREIPNVEQHIINYGRVADIVGTDLSELWPEYDGLSREGRGELIKRIMRNISVDLGEKTKSEGSTFIDLSYRDVDADRARLFLERLAAVWIEEVIQIDESRLLAERDILNEAVAAAREAFRLASDRWVQQCREMGWNPAEAPTQPLGRAPEDFYFEQLAEYRSQRAETEEALAKARNELTLLREDFAAEPARVREVEVQPGQSYAAQMARIEQEIRGLERELETITKHHHRYPRIVERIAEREAALVELQRLETADEEVETLVPNPHKEELRLAVAEKEREVANLAKTLERAQKNVADFERRVDRRSEEFGQLLTLWNELETARIEKSDAESELRNKEFAVRQAKRANEGVYRVVAPALARDTAREPSALLIVAFSLFAGLAVGLASAMVAEYARDSFRTVGDLSEVMGVPVLGAVGAIVTSRDLRRIWARRAVVGGSSAVILFGVAWVTWAWASARERLPLDVVRAIEELRNLMM